MPSTEVHRKHASVHRTTREAVDGTESGPARMVAVRRTAPASAGPVQSGRHRPAAEVRESGPARAAAVPRKA
jgi:hypothetical protein